MKEYENSEEEKLHDEEVEETEESEEETDKNSGNVLAIYMSLGMLFGAVIEQFWFHSMGIGICLGMLLGLAIGSLKNAKSK